MVAQYGRGKHFLPARLHFCLSVNGDPTLMAGDDLTGYCIERFKIPRLDARPEYIVIPALGY